MSNISRIEIINILIDQLGLKTNIATECVEAFFNEISSALISGEVVKIAGLGTMSVVYKKERLGINPVTKQKSVIQARKVVSFKCSGTLKRKLNEVN